MRRRLAIIAAIMLLGLVGLGGIWRMHAMMPHWIVKREQALARRLGLGRAAAFAAFSLGTAASAGPVPPTRLGVEVSAPFYWSGTRPFANLALSGGWLLSAKGKGGWLRYPGEDLDADGNLLRIPDNATALHALNAANTGPGGATIRCTYHGTAEIRRVLGATAFVKGAGEVQFHWINHWDGHNLTLEVSNMDPAKPLRDLDCRENTMARGVRFDPAYLDYVGQFKVLRFMDFQLTNLNAPVTWATRHTPRSTDITSADGISIEDMVALATQAHTDAWFNVPWNGDDDYVRHFAKLVHDTLPADRTVYVELSNEVWNTMFSQSKQAIREGQELGLSSDPNEAKLFRYAQRLAVVMDIWAKAFADRPAKLVRVAGSQNIPQRADMILGYRDTASHVDALATAPYFDVGSRRAPVTSADEAFAQLPMHVDARIDSAEECKKVAQKYGKRYLAYESGQSIILADSDLERAIERDPRMYDIYKRYIDGWRARIGDTMMLFTSARQIGRSGGWGLVEYDGQPASEAPKWRAVQEELKR